MTGFTVMGQDHELTERLAGIYRPVLTALRDCLPEGQGFSLPLFMAPSPEYAAARLKLMIVGQETHSWYSYLHDSANYPDVGAIQQRYSEFALGYGYRRSPFFQAIFKIQAALDPAVPRFGFVWTNLFPCDQREKLPSIEWHDALRAHSPFRAELEILKPDLVVCFTGPHYDHTLRHYFPEAAWSNVASESGLLLPRLTLPTGPRLVLRTYHPNYLVWRKILERTVAEIVHLAHALFTRTAAVPVPVAASREPSIK